MQLVEACAVCFLLSADLNVTVVLLTSQNFGWHTDVGKEKAGFWHTTTKAEMGQDMACCLSFA